MRLVLILAFSLCAAGAAQAQISNRRSLRHQPPTIPGTKPGGFKPYEGYQPPKPYQPYQAPQSQSVYRDGPFSPAGEARRERKAAAAERARQNGAFSPAGEAKRERAREKRDATINPF